MTVKRSDIREDICFEVEIVSEQEAAALKALQKGEAEPHQQTQALALIVNKFCRPHDQTYIPGHEGRTGFMSGRAFVGQQILKYLNIPVSKLPEGGRNAN